MLSGDHKMEPSYGVSEPEGHVSLKALGHMGILGTQ